MYVQYINTGVHFFSIVDREYVNDGHLEKTCGVTSHEFTLSCPVDQPEVNKTISGTIEQLDTTLHGRVYS